MLLMGDEIGRSQEVTIILGAKIIFGLMNWDHSKQDLELLNYLKYVIKIRKKLINIFNPSLLTNIQNHDNLFRYHWHGIKLDSPDWSSWSHTVAFSINKGNTDPLVWIGLNAYSKSIDFQLPKCKYNWLKVIDTSISDIFEPITVNEQSIQIESRSSILIISKELFDEVNDLI